MGEGGGSTCLALIVLAGPSCSRWAAQRLVIALGRSRAADGRRLLRAPSAARASGVGPLNSMGCILARFAKGSEEKGEEMPDDELMWGSCRPWGA